MPSFTPRTCVPLLLLGMLIVSSAAVDDACSVSGHGDERPTSRGASLLQISSRKQEACTKWEETGWYTGKTERLFTRQEAPDYFQWTWPQCAARCAVEPLCEFWTIPKSDVLYQSCMLMSGKGDYQDEPNTVEMGPKNAACEQEAQASGWQQPTDEVSLWFRRGLHSVVGSNGVLMIGLKGSVARWNQTASKLENQAWIRPTFFRGTNGKDPATPQEELDSACSNNCGVDASDASHGRAFAALAHSHMRALRAAFDRRAESNWTAIFEDDAVPAFANTGTETADKWAEAFELAWSQLPKEAKFVRLGRCFLAAAPPSETGFEIVTYASDGIPFKVTQWSGNRNDFSVAGCTTAYVVHADIIPEILEIFPCDYMLDVCYGGKLFSKPGFSEFMYDLDTDKTPDEVFWETRAKAAQNSNLTSYRDFLQLGILQQDWAELPDGATSDYAKGSGVAVVATKELTEKTGSPSEDHQDGEEAEAEAEAPLLGKVFERLHFFLPEGENLTRVDPQLNAAVETASGTALLQRKLQGSRSPISGGIVDGPVYRPWRSVPSSMLQKQDTCGFSTDCPLTYSMVSVNEAAEKSYSSHKDANAKALEAAHAQAREACAGGTQILEHGGWCYDQAASSLMPASAGTVDTDFFLPAGHVLADEIIVSVLAEKVLLREDGSCCHSITDLGAGVGQFGHALRARHPELEYHGYDGAGNVDEFTNNYVSFTDLTLPLSLKRTDWVISSEVGEHIPHEFEQQVIANIHAHNCKGVVLTWAILNQQGHGHVNNHSPEYLTKIFEDLGYTKNEAVTAALQAGHATEHVWLANSSMAFDRKVAAC